MISEGRVKVMYDEVTYDESDNLIKIETEFVDADGNPCLNDEGIAVKTIEYDSEGRKTREAYFDVDGNPVALSGYDPYDSVKTTYHDNGEVATQTWFYRVKEHPNSYAKATRKYDERGNIIEVAYFDAEGKQLELRPKAGGER